MTPDDRERMVRIEEGLAHLIKEVSDPETGIKRWLFSHNKRIEKLEHWRTVLTTGGLLAGSGLGLLWRKIESAVSIHLGRTP